jgi:SRSO17 transposase
MEPIRCRGRGWRPAGWVTYWASAVTAGCPPWPVRAAPTRQPRVCPRAPGSGFRPARGLKGQRYHDWALIALTDDSGHHRLLIRRHPRRGELAFYRCYSPTLVPLGDLVRVAGRRWTIEEIFQAGKGLTGLDEHQLRRWLPWRRPTLLAHAPLAVIAATEHAEYPPPRGLIQGFTC